MCDHADLRGGVGAKDDIKKALAFPTMAVLGPIGYAFAIFHLLTHGFFKAGMFLGAGSVMHGMWTGSTCGATARWPWSSRSPGSPSAWLAIIGVPPFSGFWSKDKIIESAFVGEGWQPWVLGGAAMVGAGITAFYMSRLFFMTFHGEKRWEDDQHPHESPLTMTVPMMVLAFGSAFLGLILKLTVITSWLAPVVGEVPEEHPVLPVAHHGAHPRPGRGGALYAWRHGRPRARGRAQGHPDHPRGPPGPLPGRRERGPVHAPRHPPDPRARLRRRPRVDGAVGGLAALVGGLSSRLRRLQTGYARSYALTMLTGVVTVLGALWVIQ